MSMVFPFLLISAFEFKKMLQAASVGYRMFFLTPASCFFHSQFAVQANMTGIGYHYTDGASAILQSEQRGV